MLLLRELGVVRSPGVSTPHKKGADWSYRESPNGGWVPERLAAHYPSAPVNPIIRGRC